MAHQKANAISHDFTTRPESWPALPLEAWQDTYATLHMWTQIVGKVRLAQSPLVNHWWEVPLYISARGLTTSAIPYRDGIFEVEFDFLDHNLVIRTSQDQTKIIPLAPRSVADFYKEFMAALASLGIDVKIWHMPVEIPNPIAFDRDTQHASYDPRICDPVLAHPAGGGQHLPGIPLALYRQEQPGAFLLGQFRLVRHALFRDGALRSAKVQIRLRAKLTRMK